MRSFLILAGLLVALVCMADGDKMMAKDGTPLPDGVARIVKWEASQYRQHKGYVALASDKELRRRVPDMPQDRYTYHVDANGGRYSIEAVGSDGSKVAYVYRWQGDGRPGDGTFRRVDIE